MRPWTKEGLGRAISKWRFAFRVLGLPRRQGPGESKVNIRGPGSGDILRALSAPRRVNLGCSACRRRCPANLQRSGFVAQLNGIRSTANILSSSGFLLWGLNGWCGARECPYALPTPTGLAWPISINHLHVLPYLAPQSAILGEHYSTPNMQARECMKVYTSAVKF